MMSTIIEEQANEYKSTTVPERASLSENTKRHERARRFKNTKITMSYEEELAELAKRRASGLFVHLVFSAGASVRLSPEVAADTCTAWLASIKRNASSRGTRRMNIVQAKSAKRGK